VRPPPDCHVGVLIRVRDDIPRSWRLEKFDETGMSALAKAGISPLEQPSTVVAEVRGGLPGMGRLHLARRLCPRPSAANRIVVAVTLLLIRGGTETSWL
jgi:hypothetical protein